MLWGNANVSKLLRIDGHTDPTTGQYNAGVFERVYFCGTNSAVPLGRAGGLTSGQSVITNQTGLWTSNPNPGGTLVACHKVLGCDFYGLDYAAIFLGQFSDMWFHDNIRIDSCEVGYVIEGVQHMLSNFRVESSSDTPGGAIHTGGTGFVLRPPTVGTAANGGSYIMMTNIQGELRKVGSILVKILAGSTSTNNIKMYNIANSADNDVDNFLVWDDNIDAQNFNYDQYNIIGPYGRTPKRGWISGANQAVSMTANGETAPYVHGGGTMSAPNVRETVTGAATYSSVNNVNFTQPQIVRRLTSGSTANASGGIQYVQSYYQRAANMKFYTRFNFQTPVPTPGTAGIRCFIGFVNIGNPVAPAIFTAPTTTPDMLDTKIGVGLWVDTVVSSGQWKVSHHNGAAGASTKDPISGNPVVDTNPHKVEIITDDGGGRFGVRYDNTMTIVSSDIPAAADRYGWLIWMQNATTATSRSLDVASVEMVTSR